VRWESATPRSIIGRMWRWMCTALVLFTAAANRADADVAAIGKWSASEARLAAQRDAIILVDVRMAGQRALGHIRGDRYVPVEEIAARAATLRSDRPFVFYCSCPAEELALEAAQTLLEHGGGKVGVLVGGFDAWRQAGGAVEVPSTWEELFHVAEPPIGWGKTPVDSARCKYARDVHVASQGTTSARVVCRPDSAARGFAGFSQRIDALPLVGRTVRFSAMVRSENVTHASYLWVAVEDPEGHIVARVRSDDDPIRGTQNWRRVAVSGLIPPGIAKVVVGVSLEASGRIWMDDVRLVATAEGGRPESAIPLVNPSFEQ